MSPTTVKEALRKEAEPLVGQLFLLKNAWRDAPALRHLSPRMIDALLEYIAQENRARPGNGYLFILLFGCFVFPTVLPNIAATALWIAMMLIVLYHGVYDPGPGKRIATCALTQTEDVRALPALLRGTRFPWGKHPEIRRAIFRLIEQVNEEHVGLLDAAAQEQLWTLGVERQDSSEIYDGKRAVQTLRALACVGNQATLERMKRFAQRSEYYLEERYHIAEAQRLIPLMEARLNQQRHPETLLRAADVPVSPPETLLRPTLVTTSEAPLLLLRAGDGEERNMKT